MKAGAIDADHPEIRLELGHNPDVVADQPAQHSQHVFHYIVQVHHFGPQHLAAAEGQQP